jgi:hypothetical protein
MVQLHLAPNGGRGDEPEMPLPVAATRIAARHSDKPVAVEVVRWRQAPAAAENAGATVTPIGPGASAPAPMPSGDDTQHGAAEGARPRLLAVLSFPDTDEVEVHLVLHGRRTIGRAAASGGLVSVVSATLDALRGFGIELAVQPLWARQVEDDSTDHKLVAVGVDDSAAERQLYGLANASTAIDAGARATLDALNRQITRALHA